MGGCINCIVDKFSKKGSEKIDWYPSSMDDLNSIQLTNLVGKEPLQSVGKLINEAKAILVVNVASK